MKEPSQAMIDITLKGARDFDNLEKGLEAMLGACDVVKEDIGVATELQMTGFLKGKQYACQIGQAKGLIEKALKLIYGSHDKCTDFCTECGTEQKLPQTRSGGR
jgi:hypothetical protein